MHKISIIALVAVVWFTVSGCTPAGNDPMPDYYIGNTASKIFHVPDCSSLPGADNQTRFDTREEAVDAGYSACKKCKP